MKKQFKQWQLHLVALFVMSAGVSVYASSEPTIKVGGFIQFDQSLSSDRGIDSNSLYGLKNVRSELSGTLSKTIGYTVNVDYAGGSFRLLDAYGQIGVLPNWNLRFGKFKSPFSFEVLQAPTSMTFIDYGYSTFFTPNRDSGVQVAGPVFGWDTQVALLTGAADYSSADKDSDGYRSLVARVFGNPFSGVKELSGLGVGLAYSTEKRVGTSATGKSQLSSYQGLGRPSLFSYSTGTYANGEFYRIAPQLSYYAGPLGLIAEYVAAGHTVTNAGNDYSLVHGAWQVQGQYYLTGESAAYGYVLPKSEYNPDNNQWGALQLTGRIQEVQFDTAALTTIGSGYKSSVSATLGLGWTWNANSKWILNVENIWNTTVAGDIDQDLYADLRLQLKY
jgi:phosphate-selective porin OprO/OprP